MITKTEKIVLILILLSMCISACGFLKQQESEEEEGLYQIRQATVEMEKEQILMQTISVGDTVLAICHNDAQGNNKYRLLKLNDEMEFQEFLIELPEGSSPVGIVSNGTETFTLLTVCILQDKKEYYFYTYNIKGELAGYTNISDMILVSENEDYVLGNIKTAEDNKGKLYLVDFDAQKIIILENNGKLLCEIDCRNSKIRDIVNVNGDVYAVGRNGETNVLYYIDAEHEMCIKKADMPDTQGTAKLWTGQKSTLLYSTGDGLFTYVLESGKLQPVCRWTDLGIDTREINSVCMKESGQILVFLNKKKGEESGSYILLETKLENQPVALDRQEIVLAANTTDPALRYIVGQFNVSNKEYFVTIRDYDEDRLLTEMITGNGPDLIWEKSVSLEECVRRGLLEDLTPFLEKSQILSEDELISEVLDAYTINDVLTCIPPTFGINTLYGKQSELGNKSGWTMEEFFEYVDAHRGCTIYEGSTYGDSKLLLVITSWWSQPEKWVDWEKKKAYFDTEDFCNLVEFAAEYEDKYVGDTRNTLAKWQDGEILLINWFMSSPEEYMYVKSLMKDDMVAIGYPSAEGKPCHRISGDDAFGINSTSENKDGAWAFIEFMVNSQTERNPYSLARFPTKREAFEAMLDEACKPVNDKGYTTFTYSDSYSLEIYPAERTDVDNIERILTDTTGKSMRNAVIESILLEELEVCFAGERSVEDTVQIIQNRIQLYLDEM